jgi:Flp pilus assembly pilin Flp
MFAKLRAFRKDESGAATIEFVAVFFAFIAILMFVIETAVYLFFVASVEKAAEAGVRLAVVSWPVSNENRILGTIGRNDGDFGESCDMAAGDDNACTPFVAVRCGGGTAPNCGSGNSNSRASRSFAQIVAEMRRYNANIQSANVSIAYTDVGIGFAGGSRVPMVTVTVDRLRYETGIFGLLLGNTATSLRFLPARSASMTGESLGQ